MSFTRSSGAQGRSSAKRVRLWSVLDQTLGRHSRLPAVRTRVSQMKLMHVSFTGGGFDRRFEHLANPMCGYCITVASEG